MKSEIPPQHGEWIINDMSFSVKTHSLSAVSPVNFTYQYNTEEKLNSTLHLYRGGFGHYDHKLLEKFQDAALSKQNCLVLTDVKSLQDVFKDTLSDVSFGEISGSLYLKTTDGRYVMTRDNRLYIGGAGEKAFFNIVPVQDGKFELKLSRTKFIEIEQTYPYTANITEEIVDETQTGNRRFEIDYRNNKISFKIITPDGYRFLSYAEACSERIVRAIGLELNDVVVNPYKFVVEFVSESNIKYNFDPQTKEVKYFNELLAFESRHTVDIKQQIINETNLIVSCPTTELSKPLSAVNINIALAKTNFSSSGTFTPSQ